ncbi:hypothetical protein OGAPHI_004846 [Ogataea philodendri]|uniref:Uncharacterized protein n=1 Tax=Ogataea philodendri TaxID=1378263 RepID=A0A9P8P2Q9_9ASCO|nr:uncharacterized protein OGAPHI_004846 [Ogataea philodendri]KAH3664132.1 hypothetical protein OGAPHI_004846 [Ogataea philodendri]
MESANTQHLVPRRCTKYALQNFSYFLDLHLKTGGNTHSPAMLNSSTNTESTRLQEVRLARAKLNTYKSFDAEEDFEFCPIVSSQRYFSDHSSPLPTPQQPAQIDSASLFKILAAAHQKLQLPQVNPLPAFDLHPRQTNAESSSKHTNFNYVSDTPTTGSEAASSNASSLKIRSISSKTAEQLQSIYHAADDKGSSRVRIVSN